MPFGLLKVEKLFFGMYDYPCLRRVLAESLDRKLRSGNRFRPTLVNLRNRGGCCVC